MALNLETSPAPGLWIRLEALKMLSENKQSFRVLDDKTNILPQLWPCLSRGSPKWVFTVVINAEHLNRGYKVNVDTLLSPIVRGFFLFKKSIWEFILISKPDSHLFILSPDYGYRMLSKNIVKAGL